MCVSVWVCFVYACRVTFFAICFYVLCLCSVCGMCARVYVTWMCVCHTLRGYACHCLLTCAQLLKSYTRDRIYVVGQEPYRLPFDATLPNTAKWNDMAEQRVALDVFRLRDA